LTICLRRDFTEGLRPAAIPGLPSPPLAAILELHHSSGRSSEDRLVFVAA
jgi:hypothetical protein